MAHGGAGQPAGHPSVAADAPEGRLTAAGGRAGLGAGNGQSLTVHGGAAEVSVQCKAATTCV